MIACPECDALLNTPEAHRYKKLSCPRCQHVLSSGGETALARAFPLAISAAVLLILSLMFPFMSFERAGVANEMSLIATSFALFKDGSTILGMLVLVFVVAAPLVLVCCSLIVSYVVWSNKPMPGMKAAARVLYRLASWSMVEVFIIGVFVSLVKIAKMANVELGFSLWTYLALAICLAGAIVSLDKLLVWRRLNELAAR